MKRKSIKYRELLPMRIPYPFVDHTWKVSVVCEYLLLPLGSPLATAASTVCHPGAQSTHVHVPKLAEDAQQHTLPSRANAALGLATARVQTRRARARTDSHAHTRHAIHPDARAETLATLPCCALPSSTAHRRTQTHRYLQHPMRVRVRSPRPITSSHHRCRLTSIAITIATGAVTPHEVRTRGSEQAFERCAHVRRAVRPVARLPAARR